MILPSAGDELDDLAIAAAYACPRDRWLRANMVASADGAAYVDGLTRGLNSPGDMRIFGILRVLADVVLAGAGTIRAERYTPARRRAALAASLRKGRPATPPIAVISRSLELDLAGPLFTQAPPDGRTIVITCEAAPADLRAKAAQVADVIVAGHLLVDLPAAVEALGDRGLTRVLCEGGPHLLGQLAGAGLVDELCLSLSPTLAGPGAARILAGAPFTAARSLTLTHVLAEDGFLFCRYRTEKPDLPG